MSYADVLQALEIKEDQSKCRLCKGTGYVISKETMTATKCVCLTDKQREQLPDRYRNKRFHDFDTKGYDNQAYIDKIIDRLNEINPRQMSKGLYIQGGVGRGKTLFASCIFNIFIEEMEVRFIKTSNLIGKIIDSFNGKAFDVDKYKEAEFLILDDLGVEKTTEFAEGVLFGIIDYRYERKLPTVITSNIALDDLAKAYPKNGERMASRLMEMTPVLPLIGADRRKNAK